MTIKITDLAAADTPLAGTEEVEVVQGGVSKRAAFNEALQSDQAAATIKTSYESNTDTNAFTDAEQTKLGAIEAGATADQSAAEIKTLYESNADTNEFSDAEQTKLAGIETAADVTDDANVTSALSTATITAVTVATDDQVLIKDTSNSDNLRTASTQSIADLAAASLPVADTTGVVKGSADGTKIVRIEADGLTTATTRVITMPDSDVDLGNLVELTGDQTVAGDKTLTGTTLQTGQPRFSAYNSATDMNVTGDGTTVTVDFNTEIVDVGADFAGDTYTASVAGEHILSACVRGTGFDASMDQIEMRIVTTLRDYLTILVRTNDLASHHAMTRTVVADMDAGDTAHVTYRVVGSGLTADVFGGTLNSTQFSGWLLG